MTSRDDVVAALIGAGIDEDEPQFGVPTASEVADALYGAGVIALEVDAQVAVERAIATLVAACAESVQGRASVVRALTDAGVLVGTATPDRDGTGVASSESASAWVKE